MRACSPAPRGVGVSCQPGLHPAGPGEWAHPAHIQAPPEASDSVGQDRDPGSMTTPPRLRARPCRGGPRSLGTGQPPGQRGCEGGWRGSAPPPLKGSQPRSPPLTAGLLPPFPLPCPRDPASDPVLGTPAQRPPRKQDEREIVGGRVLRTAPDPARVGFRGCLPQHRDLWGHTDVRAAPRRAPGPGDSGGLGQHMAWR